MLIDIDLHCLSEIAHSFAEMDRMINGGECLCCGSLAYAQLNVVFNKHRENVMRLANVIAEHNGDPSGARTVIK